MTSERCSKVQAQHLVVVCKDPHIFQVVASNSKSENQDWPQAIRGYEIKFIAQVELVLFWVNSKQ
jgi:hypothetical protein